MGLFVLINTIHYLFTSSCEGTTTATIDDMILLDFSKAFDTVPYCRLLKKLEYYHIDGQVIHWIEKWLTIHKQRVY